MQSTVERSLYILLLLMFVLAIVGTSIATVVYIDLRKQQTQLHSQSVTDLTTIEQNQVLQTEAIKDYFACLLSINPQGNLSIQEQVCFNSAPIIKQ